MLIRGVFLAAGLLTASSAFAAETPIGEEQHQGDMTIGAVYLQPIEMEPENIMRAAASSDVHLEADIHAAKGNPTGFAEGDWMPYLVVNYTLTKEGGQTQKGELMPMVANDGPHYGDNVKLQGPGKYKMTLTIAPPSTSPHAMFGRHVDKETGVGPWFKPFTLDYEFVYAGTGKKGGY
jgi:uncharacterized protein involved in high-affinity Fe2+ transport